MNRLRSKRNNKRIRKVVSLVLYSEETRKHPSNQKKRRSQNQMSSFLVTKRWRRYS